MANLWREIRTGIHTLESTPGATAVALLTLALGIGANTAIFSLLNAVVLRPLPVPHQRCAPSNAAPYSQG